MFRKVAIIAFALLVSVALHAQQPPVAADSLSTGPHMRISLITCGPGNEEIYEVFGHTAIRIIDSTQHTDLVYNYGTFAYGPDFEMKFMKGKLLYYLDIDRYDNFVMEYVKAKRKVEEQVLLLNDEQKVHVYNFLEWNAEPANKYYKYDFFFDNCATRIRDIFPKPDVFGTAFQYGRALPQDQRLSFRDIINIYFAGDHWTRTGVNILLGSRIDRVMTNDDIMFLPDYLRDGIAGATVNGQKIAAPASIILAGTPLPKPGINGPLLMTCVVAILTILGLSIKRLRVLGRVMGALLFLVTGLLGILILVMWFGTDHQGCGNNFNILWCLPTNLILAFFRPKGASRYSLVAIVLILASFVLHLLKIQCIIPEFYPLFAALLFLYGTIYKNSTTKAIVANA